MSSDFEYASLISSLPRVEHWSQLKRMPISQFQLSKRFKALNSQDLFDIEVLVELLDWNSYSLEATDQKYIDECKKLLPQVYSQSIRNIIIWRLELRTVVAALRHKYFCGDVKAVEDWGYGRWSHYIPKHWHDKYLGLGSLLPWVCPLVESIREENPVACENIILNEIWRWLDQISLGHQFDMQAVAIYWMRWNTVSQFVQQKSEIKDQHTFEKIVGQALTGIDPASIAY